MTVSSTDSRDLQEYEKVIADLVDELHQYKNAVTSLNDAVEASREIHARAKAVGTMTETVLDRADSIFAELQRLDTPSLIPRLSAMEEAISKATSDVHALQEACTSMEQTVGEVVRSAREANDINEKNQESVMRVTEKIAANAIRSTYLIYGLLLCDLLLFLLIVTLRS
jgi:uncharacterized membrane protein